MHRRLPLLPLLACALIAAPAQAASAPDAGTAFEPTPVSKALYGTQAPDRDPARQRKVLTAHDGVALYVETWLPAAKGANVPPARIPTVLIMTPYVTQGVERYPARNLANTIQWFTQRGYAVAQADVRGTGESGGCIEQTAANQIDDGARYVEYLGRDAPWTNGAVGMYGISYDGETQISTAGRGDPAKTKYLKAIVPVETVAGQYEYSNYDGVPFAGQALLSNGGYFASSFSEPGATTGPQQVAEKTTCVPEMMAGALDPTGDMTPFWQAREYRPHAQDIKAATLMVHGFTDFNVLPAAVAGFFDRLPASTPKAGLFGYWEHNMPDKHAGVEPTWARQDFLPLVTAWYDRWLKGLDSGADAWPVAQVQDSTGQWRSEPDFPSHGGPAGQLALGPGGALGATAPTGADDLVGGADEEDTVPGSRVVYETPALAAPLHLSGQPVADLWLTTLAPTAQIGARIEVVGADGTVLKHAGSDAAPFADFGYRSLRHLDPMPKGWFEQAAGKLPATNTPLRVPVRLMPTDLVVPAGGRLRLTVSSAGAGLRQTVPSGLGAPLTILHDAAHPSALRFLMPAAGAPLLNVREVDQATGTLASAPATAGTADGGGLAVAPVHGAAPFDPQRLVTTGS